MLTFRKGTAAAPTAAIAMAEHLREQTVPEDLVGMADYYLRGVRRAEAEGTAAAPREDMSPRVAEGLGIDPTRTVTHEEVVNLLQGRRADGSPIRGLRQQLLGAGRDRITYIDFTFSAPKSVSVAMALAPTEAERHMLVGAHRDAVRAAMAHLETIVAHARKGEGGCKGSVRGELGWITFDHYTARPTIEIPFTEADGTPTTLIQTVANPKIAGDMQLHTHVTTPTAVFAQDGTVGSLDSLAMHDRVLEVGAYYQAHLATNLRAFGIAVDLDPRTDTARLPAVPAHVVDHFSRRTRDGEVMARAYVRERGLDWDALHPMELAGIMKGATRAARRSKETGNRGDDLADVSNWKQQAEAAGYVHASVVDPAARNQLPPPERDRLLRAYAAALPLLEKQFSRRATMYATVARVAAARGLIAAGVQGPEDIDRVTAAMREHGVAHNGRTVPLVWADVAPENGPAMEGRRRRVRITTSLHVEQERETMRLIGGAAADRSGALSPAAIERAIRTVEARDGLDFTGAHGIKQRQVIRALGVAGRFGAAVGVAGAGKTSLLRPLVEAWRNPDAGTPREVYGIALAWRQSEPLADAGIERRNAMAIAAFLARADVGTLNLGPSSVVVVDELSQVGTAQALALARLQERHGFSIVAIGDDRQAQAVEAGNSIALIRRALGTAELPTLDSSVRQRRERDRDTALMFRDGNAAAAIDRLREDGHARLVAGGRVHAIAAVADLWEQRRAANEATPGYKLTVSAPTNADAHAISAEIRLRRRRDGLLGPDERVVQATDQNGAEYDLALARGDHLRLFERTAASYGGRGGNIGNNGSVVVVEGIAEDGLTLTNSHGTRGFVKWETLQAPNGRMRLAYGDVLTIDAVQSATSSEHINALPSGSASVEAFKAYVAQSRARGTTYLVASDGRERGEVMGRRALGSTEPITESDAWANVARNLSRQPERELATDLLRQAHRVHFGATRTMASAFQPREQQRASGQPEPNGFARQRDEQAVAKAMPAIAHAVAKATAARPTAEQARQAVRDARRSMRPPAARPKQKGPPPMTPTEAQAEFADALYRAGLRLKGAPIMDGKLRRVPVDGDKKGRLSGSYKGHLDGLPAGYIHNFKTGEEHTWRATRAYRELTPEQRRQANARMAEERAAREAERRHAQAVAAHRAQVIWNRATPAGTGQGYLKRKGVMPHGTKVDRHGHLLVPMRDAAGVLWGLQTISPAPSGPKLYQKNARRDGTHALLGEVDPLLPLVIAEGFATAATVREATGLPVVVAFDSGGLGAVARIYRTRHPDLPILFAADNDHHLPRRSPPLPNVGHEKALAAAAEVGGLVALPEFKHGETGADWNDYAMQRGDHGHAAVRQAIREVVRPLGVTLPPPLARVVTTQADRDAARQRGTVRPPDPNEAARRALQARPSGPRL